jgi:hypothetical protein
MDKVDPAKDPMGHLLIDAPEFLAATIAGLKAAKQAGCTVYKEKQGNNALVVGLRAACLAGTVAATSSYIVASIVKQINRDV